MNTVVCPADFSRPSDSALRFASALARQIGGKLVILHIVRPRMAALAALDPSGKLARAIATDSEASEAGERMQALAPADEVEYEQVLRVGDPAREIVRFADEVNAAQIVMGARARGGFHRALMGNTAESVVRDAPCPVTVVRADDDPAHA